MSQLKAILEKFNRTEGVEGSLICGHDGIVVESALGARFNAHEMAALVSSVHLAVANGVEDFKFNRANRYQMASRNGSLVVCDLGRGLFVAALAGGTEVAAINAEIFQAANEIKKHANLG
ncbi:MAG: roadblock/LC7 domain-containing protein [Nitrospinae bacterium]|nr:roadblock/LC7 domain-containing protein [Nitrospinota bacterium]